MRNMRNPVSDTVVSLFIVLCSFVCLVVSALNNNVNSNRLPNLENFQYCLQKSQKPRLQECVGRVAISFLQRFDEKENYTIVDDLVTAKNETISGRSLVNLLDTDPVDFRGILENAGAVVSQRSFEWHMDGLYPGLMLKIGPTANANSVAEFVIDPVQNEREFSFQEPSTARILAKQYLLPVLLGLKFNLVALVPLLFGGILLLLKKSLFLAKLAIYASSFLGLGGVAGLLSGLTGLGGLGGLGGFGGIGGTGLIGGLGAGGLLPVGPHRDENAAFDIGSSTGQAGYFPGKTTIFNQHFEPGGDELYHASPYKRNERKLNFNMPRESIETGNVAITKDRFYDYENKKVMQGRAGKSLSNSGKLGPTAYDDGDDITKTIYQNNEQSGWKVVDMRG